VLSEESLWAEEGPGSTAIAGVWRQAGLAGPLPLTVDEALARVR
jgi:hypothetical protein